MSDHPAQSRNDTRTRLLEAALEAFGSRDYDGVSTREIVEMAGANISAISYHFEHKQGLYHATVAYLTEILKAGMAEQLDSLEEWIKHASPEDCADKTCSFLLHYFEHILLGEVGKHAPGIIFREQNRPTEAFQILFENLLAPMHKALAQLVAKYRGQSANDPQVLFMVHTLLGQTIIFRIAQTTLLKILKQKQYSQADINAIKEQLRSQCQAILDTQTIPIHSE
ncbi:MAG: CerR family C-terminal domain-containing protein [Candidatus Thiodiazotropha sp. 'RUGA']|nr:CerR family C-terminal domain-containing protein [Candidatus Thiodiazotropha sp. 'RUGA']